MRPTILVLAVLPLLAFAGPLRARHVRGIVRDEVSHQPISAADVMLLGSEGEVVGRDVTGADGRFAIAIPRFGAYAVPGLTVTTMALRPSLVRNGFYARQAAAPVTSCHRNRSKA